MRPEQTVLEMVEEVLERQARTQAAWNGLPYEVAMREVAETEAGRQLRELTNGEHRNDRAAEWQASLPWHRLEERHYSWVEGYMKWSREREKRTEYHALLEEELASLSG